METNPVAKKKTFEVKAKGKGPTARMPEKIVEQPKSKKYKEANGNLGDLIIKSETMSNILKDGVYRRIRYVKGAISIFVDKQGDVRQLKIEPIVFYVGEKLVTDPLLMQYLDASDQNVENGGKVFSEVDAERDAQAILDKEGVIAEAVYMANKGLKIDKVRAVARALGVSNVSGKTDSVIRLDAVNHAKRNPQLFVETVNSPLPDVIESVAVAFELGKIELSADKYHVSWAGSNSSFLKIPPGYEDERIEWIAKYLLTEEGADLLEAINKAIKK